MKFNWKEKFLAFKDLHRKNEYELVPYVINDGKKHPFALVCPGGGYGAVCSFVEGRPFVERLNEMGYSAFVLYYRVRNKARFPAPQDDLARAVREILSRAEEWHLDIEGYSVWGSSAGGHLTATFGTESMGYVKYGLPKPGALVLTYPVITMGEKTHLGSRENLLGKDATAAQINAASVEKQITEHYPPTFVWCGDADKLVHPDNSRMLKAILDEKGIPCTFKEYPGIDHGVGLGQGLVCENWIKEAVSFWAAQRALQK